MEQFMMVLVFFIGVSIPMYIFLFKDFGDHPIINLAFTIPCFYTLPISYIFIGTQAIGEVAGVICLILGIIQTIAHIIIVIKCDDLYISQLSFFAVVCIAHIFRALSVLFFILCASRLIENILNERVSLIKVVLDMLT